MFYFVSIFLHGDSCPTGSANPEEGCESEGYQCGPDGCGNYIHGICQDCDQSSDDDDNVDDEREEDEDQQGSNPAKKSCIISIHKSERNPRFIHIAFN